MNDSKRYSICILFLSWLAIFSIKPAYNPGNVLIRFNLQLYWCLNQGAFQMDKLWLILNLMYRVYSLPVLHKKTNARVKINIYRIKAQCTNPKHTQHILVSSILYPNRDVLSLILVYQYQFPYNSKWSSSSELTY